MKTWRSAAGPLACAMLLGGCAGTAARPPAPAAYRYSIEDYGARPPGTGLSDADLHYYPYVQRPPAGDWSSDWSGPHLAGAYPYGLTDSFWYRESLGFPGYVDPFFSPYYAGRIYVLPPAPPPAPRPGPTSGPPRPAPPPASPPPPRAVPSRPPARGQGRGFERPPRPADRPSQVNQDRQ